MTADLNNIQNTVYVKIYMSYKFLYKFNLFSQGSYNVVLYIIFNAPSPYNTVHKTKINATMYTGFVHNKASSESLIIIII